MKNKFLSNLNKIVENPLFFIFIFIYLAAISIIQMLTSPIPENKIVMYSIYCFFQAEFLSFFLCSIYGVFNHYFKKKGTYIFISIIFLLLFYYFVNFILIQLLNTSLFSALNMFFNAGTENIMVTIRAANINIYILILIPFFLVLIPIIGIIIFNFFNKLSLKIKTKITYKKLLIPLTLSFFSLLFFDYITATAVSNNYSHKEFTKRLPVHISFFSPKKQIISFPSKIAELRDEKETHSLLEKTNWELQKKPNIFLFIVETFRDDFITEKITPNLFKLKNENFHTEHSFANSNASNISWYSILHSNLPIYWEKSKQTYSKGSIPLHILKKAGYKINVLSSAELQYFDMDKVLFGNNFEAIDEFEEFSSTKNPEAYKRDELGFKKLSEKLNSKEGNVFIVFLDSPHSEYSFPEDYKNKFTPMTSGINYIKMSFSKSSIEEIKNRYKTALNYLDNNFKMFFNKLKENNLWDDSIIVITGDHGEEFFENNYLFHNSNLNNYQLRIPIIYKFPKQINLSTNTISSQMDIFPTIFNVLYDKDLNLFFDGQSIFNKNKCPYIMSASRSILPNHFDFLIHNNKNNLFGIIKDNLNFEFIYYKNDNNLFYNIDDSINKEFENELKNISKSFSNNPS